MNFSSCSKVSWKLWVFLTLPLLVFPLTLFLFSALGCFCVFSVTEGFVCSISGTVWKKRNYIIEKQITKNYSANSRVLTRENRGTQIPLVPFPLKVSIWPSLHQADNLFLNPVKPRFKQLAENYFLLGLSSYLQTPSPLVTLGFRLVAPEAMNPFILGDLIQPRSRLDWLIYKPMVNCTVVLNLRFGQSHFGLRLIYLTSGHFWDHWQIFCSWTHDRLDYHGVLWYLEVRFKKLNSLSVAKNDMVSPFFVSRSRRYCL